MFWLVNGEMMIDKTIKLDVGVNVPLTLHRRSREIEYRVIRSRRTYHMAGWNCKGSL